MGMRNIDGHGVHVIIIGDKGKGDAKLFNSIDIKYESCWNTQWAPSLVQTSDGEIHLNTPFSQLLGKPPIMVAGMTPLTVKLGVSFFI